MRRPNVGEWSGVHRSLDGYQRDDHTVQHSSYGGGQEDFNCDACATTTASLSVTITHCNHSN
jgi:hypothetical protein